MMMMIVMIAMMIMVILKRIHQNTFEKGGSLGRLAPVLNPPESLKCVFGSAEVLKLVPWYVQWMMIGYL